MKTISIMEQRGIGAVGIILLIPVLLIVALIAWVGFAEARKAYWDSEVREMCAKDGGVKVLEKAIVPEFEYAELMNNFGPKSIQAELLSPSSAPLFTTTSSSYIRSWNPEVRRDVMKIIRKGDRKELGISTSYSRVGGDVFALQPSAYRCPEVSGDLFSAVVRKKEIEK